MAQATISTVSVVQRMYECFNQGDMETIRTEVFADDLVWHLPGHHPLAGTKHGADEVIAFFGQLVKSGIKVDLISITGTDDAVYEVHKGYAVSNGATLDALNCTVYQIRDGKIAEVQVYLSDQHGADTYFWANYDLKALPDRLA